MVFVLETIAWHASMNARYKEAEPAQLHLYVVIPKGLCCTVHQYLAVAAALLSVCDAV